MLVEMGTRKVHRMPTKQPPPGQTSKGGRSLARQFSNQPAGQRERAAVRRLQALQLRTAGASYRTIAAANDCSLSTAHKDVDEAIRELAERQRHATERLVALEVARLDRQLLGLAAGMEAGNIAAIAEARRNSESRRKLLGLDRDRL
jgi:hypothetical protein